MKRTHDKYGRGSAAANDIGFVDLEPGDTFDGLVCDGERKLATITLKQNQGQHNIYSVEALEINEDAESERTPRGAISEDLNSAPLQNLASQLANKITYYVGDVKRTLPSFIASEEPFSVERAASEILMMGGASVMKQTNLTVIILTGKEELHIRRCLERLRDLNPLQVKVEGRDEVKVDGVGLVEKCRIVGIRDSNLYEPYTTKSLYLSH